MANKQAARLFSSLFRETYSRCDANFDSRRTASVVKWVFPTIADVLFWKSVSGIGKNYESGDAFPYVNRRNYESAFSMVIVAFWRTKIDHVLQ
jgi:hypothetical protein